MKAYYSEARKAEIPLSRHLCVLDLLQDKRTTPTKQWADAKMLLVT